MIFATVLVVVGFLTIFSIIRARSIVNTGANKYQQRLKALQYCFSDCLIYIVSIITNQGTTHFFLRNIRIDNDFFTKEDR